MLKNYIKIAWRNLLKNRLFSFINIFGLAFALATCFVLILYIFNETSYDKHYKDVNQLYRIATETNGHQLATTPAPLAEALKEQIPEVTESVRVLKFPNTDHILLINEKTNDKFYQSNGYYVDSTYFKIFSLQLKYGDKKTALTQPNTVVISAKIAEKMFGQVNPIDQVIKVEFPHGTNNYTVKGVLAKTTYKSHIEPELLFSMQNNDIGSWISSLDNWANNNLFSTYLKVIPDTKRSDIQAKLNPFWKRNAEPDFKDTNVRRTVFLQPVKDIYLTSDLTNEISKNGSMTYIYIFSTIAIFLILIGCVNFMNLSTARSEKRAKEVGVRKVMGVQKGALIKQFLSESILLSIFALGLAIILVISFLPIFNNFVHKDLALMDYPRIILWMGGVTLLTGFIAGLYPALYLSSFKPISVLKGKLYNSIAATNIRKGLVVFQFTISAALILISMLIWQQLDFVQTKDLGFNQESQLIIPFRNQKSAANFTALKNEALKNPNISAVTAGSTYPGFEMVNDIEIRAENKSVEDNIYMRFAQVDDNYVETMGYEILNGRTVSNSSPADSTAIVLNETAIKQLGYTINNAVGKKVYYNFRDQQLDMTIIGVVKDFNFQSLHESIAPYGIVNIGKGVPNYFIANVNKNGIQDALAAIEKIWTSINPSTPFEYSFMQDDFQKNYIAEEVTSKIIVLFTIIAIFIACIGLFGLASYSAEQKRKEIGIRKVLGSSIFGITILQLKEFLKLVILGHLIASPLAFYFGQKWLQNFAYRIDIGWTIFLKVTAFTIIIAMVTIGYQVLKAALANPVKSLRSE